MPKSPTEEPYALKRNKACLTCRKRKLKCDAVRPACATCIKSHQLRLAADPSFTGSVECVYDPEPVYAGRKKPEPRGKRLREMEDKIAQLEAMLRAQMGQPPPPAPPTPASTLHSYVFPSTSAAPHAASTPAPNPHGISPLDILASASSSYAFSPPPPLSNPTPPPPPPRNLCTSSYSEQHQQPLDAMDLTTPPDSGHVSSASAGAASPNDPFAGWDLLLSGWPSDFPAPDIAEHLVELFFSSVPIVSGALHRASFLARLRLPPTHTNYPHSAVMHAIFASAARYSPHIHCPPVKPQPVFTEQHAEIFWSNTHENESFVERHAAKAKALINTALASGQRLLEIMQAVTILAFFTHAEARWVELWVLTGFSTRCSVPLGLNIRYNPTPRAPMKHLLDPPKDALEREERKYTMWCSYILDRCASAASGCWAHSIADEDITIRLPGRRADFEAGRCEQVGESRQHLRSPDLLTVHPPEWTDSFVLLLKAFVLFGRVAEFNNRAESEADIEGVSDPRLTSKFKMIDSSIGAFRLSFPKEYREPLQAMSGTGNFRFDACLYLAHLIPLAATITLHNPFATKPYSQCPSATRCLTAARGILSTLYHLSATSFDLSRLPSFTASCWGSAAKVFIRECAAAKEEGNRAAEEAIKAELNVIDLADAALGERLPIGNRQREGTKLLMAQEGLLGDFSAKDMKFLDGVAGCSISNSSLYGPLARPTDAARALDILPWADVDVSPGPVHMDSMPAFGVLGRAVSVPAPGSAFPFASSATMDERWATELVQSLDDVTVQAVMASFSGGGVEAS